VHEYDEFNLRPMEGAEGKRSFDDFYETICGGAASAAAARPAACARPRPRRPRLTIAARERYM
jgi:hypothetical protein